MYVNQEGEAPTPAGPPAAPREEHRNSPQHRRHTDAGRFFRWTAIGTLLPGSGLVAAGRRRSGLAVLGLLVLAALTVVAVLLLVPRSTLLALAVSPGELRTVGAGLAVTALAWLVVALASHHALEPAGLRTGQRLLGAGLVILLASAVITPLALASRYAFVQRDLVDTVFEGTEEQGLSYTRPQNVTRADPWAGATRVNVLLLGGDAGEGRIGTRTDTMIVASFDTRTGDAVLLSLPRNLQNVPFPEDSPLRQFYPRGFRGRGDVGEYLLNAVYPNVPALHPEVFEGVTDPGAEALKLATSEALGLDVDYYALVNLNGFQQIVDALGGIELNVRQRIPIGTKVLSSGVCSRPQEWIEPGVQTLDGFHALWFARARCGAEGVSDDYDRIQRQRCVIGAMIDQADPATLLRRYQQLASATKDIVQTDVPQELLPAFADLALKAKGATIRSLAFTPDTIDGFQPASPDYAQIQAMVAAALAPAPTATSEPDATGAPQPAAPGATTAPVTPQEPAPASDPARGEDLDAVC